MTKHLLLAGGGHAHLAVLADAGRIVRAGHAVTLLTPSKYLYYSGLAPAMLQGCAVPQDCRLDVAALAARGGVRFVAGELVGLDAAAKVALTDTGEAIAFDLCSLDTGSRPSTLPGEALPGVYAVKPVENLVRLRGEILALCGMRVRPRVLVVGGGPAGFEIAAALASLVGPGFRGPSARERPEVLVAAGSGLLRAESTRLRRLARGRLDALGVVVLEGARVVGLFSHPKGGTGPAAARVTATPAGAGGGSACLADGRNVAWDMAVLANGTRPRPDVSAWGLATGASGGLLVNACLQSLSHSCVFGGGDAVDFSPRALPKLGVYAVRQGPVLARNLFAALNALALEPFTATGGAPLRIFNAGNGRAILAKGPLIFEGRPAMWLKNRIDRAFLRRHAASCG